MKFHLLKLWRSILACFTMLNIVLKNKIFADFISTAVSHTGLISLSVFLTAVVVFLHM